MIENEPNTQTIPCIWSAPAFRCVPKKEFSGKFFLKDLGLFGIQASGELLSATISQPEAVKFLLHLKPEIKKKLIIHVKRKE